IDPVASRGAVSAAAVSAAGAAAAGALATVDVADRGSDCKSIAAVLSAGLKISVSRVDVVSQAPSQSRQDAAAKLRVTLAFIGTLTKTDAHAQTHAPLSR